MDYLRQYDFPTIQNYEFFGKKAKGRRADRGQRKEARHARREARREARTQRQLNGEGFFQKIGGAASNFLNNFNSGEMALGAGKDMQNASNQESIIYDTNEGNNNQMYIIIGVVAVLVLFFVFKDKF